MKRIINTAIVYFIFAMAGGVFYREFTKWNGYTEPTTLGVLHVHLLVMGTLLFLITALFAKVTMLAENLLFKKFFVLYNIALPAMVVMMLGGKLVTETVDAILNDAVKPIPQEEMAVVGELRPAPKIFKDTCRIDWNQPVKRIYDFIRGLSPYPAAWSELVQPDGETVVMKIFETEKIIQSHQLTPGTLLTDGKTYIHVAAADGFIVIRALQLPGKKRLKTDELLRGFRLTEEFRVK